LPLATFPLGPDVIQVLRLTGNPNLKAEEIRDYEVGYRSELTKTLSLDVATFLSFYRSLETTEPGTPGIVPGSPVQIIIPATFENKARATNYGGEVSLNWNANSRWRISPGYSYLHANLYRDPSSQGSLTSSIATDFPQNTFQIRSLVNLSRRMDFDQSLYYTARLPGGNIPGHARLDLRLSRRIGESTEVSLVGQNLLRSRSLEYGDSAHLVGTQTVRSVYGKITWRF
jgi:outer membrane receptor protein involved in Fe transport